MLAEVSPSSPARLCVSQPHTVSSRSSEFVDGRPMVINENQSAEPFPALCDLCAVEEEAGSAEGNA